ncbi:KUP/HAK/KT family potassium transporter, partial [Methanomethylovorans sp.]
ISVLFVMYEFKESSKLAAAYGLTVTGSMAITGIMMTMIFSLRKDWTKATVSFLVTVVDLVFLVSNMYKIPHGGIWSITIASLIFSMIMIYTSGQKRLYQSLRPMKLDDFLQIYKQRYQNANRIKGTALFFARNVNVIPQYIPHTMFGNDIVYEDNIIISIASLEEPFGVKSSFKEELAPGLRTFDIEMGYMEVVDVAKILENAGIREKTIFYGVEDIITNNPVWKVFSMIKKLTPSFVQYYKLPPEKLHGVITRFEM